MCVTKKRVKSYHPRGWRLWSCSLRIKPGHCSFKATPIEARRLKNFGGECHLMWWRGDMWEVINKGSRLINLEGWEIFGLYKRNRWSKVPFERERQRETDCDCDCRRSSQVERQKERERGKRKGRDGRLNSLVWGNRHMGEQENITWGLSQPIIQHRFRGVFFTEQQRGDGGNAIKAAWDDASLEPWCGGWWGGSQVGCLGEASHLW